MHDVTFAALSQSLPRGAGSPVYAGERLGLAHGSRDFVPPTFRSERSGDEGASVVLIAAPAAVGKSYLARRLSSDLNAVYWNLADYALGSNFFVGTAVREYGPSGYIKFIEELASGRRALILDAADEALVRSGRENYAAAIANIRQLVGEGQAPSIVILGRPDTIEETAAVLRSESVNSVRYDITYFDAANARAFVKSKARNLGLAKMRAFDVFLDNFFDDVAVSLGAESWLEASPVLGYAPVLDALATFYTRASNPLKALEQVNRSEDDSHVWRILSSIMQEVLEREQDKFGRIFGDGDLRKTEFARSAYTPRAQLAYLLDASLTPQAFVFELQGPDAWLEELEEEMARQLDEHPFRKHGSGRRDANPLMRFANAAYRDYVIAHALVDEELIPHVLLQAFWRGVVINPAPLLVGFLYAAAENTDRLLPSITFGMLFESHSASGARDVRSFLQAQSNVEEDGSINSVSVTRYLSRAGTRQTLNIAVEDKTVSITRSVSRAFMDLQGLDLRLGDGSSDIALGPRLFFLAEVVTCMVAEVRVLTGRADPSVVMSVANIAGTTKSIVSGRHDAMRVFALTSNLSFPWRHHVAHSQSSSIGVTFEVQDAMELRRYILWFGKPSMHGKGLRYPVGPTETLIAKGRLSANLFAFLQSRDFVTIEHEEYVLSLPVSAAAIYANDLSDEAFTRLLADFAAWKAAH